MPQGWDDWRAEITDGDVDYTDFQLADSQGTARRSRPPTSQYSTSLLGRKAVSFIQDTETNHPTQPLFLYLAPFAPHPDAVPATGDNHVYDSMTWRHRRGGAAVVNQDPVNGPSVVDRPRQQPEPHGEPANPAKKFLGTRDTEHRNEMEALLEVDRQVDEVVRALGGQATPTPCSCSPRTTASRGASTATSTRRTASSRSATGSR